MVAISVSIFDKTHFVFDCIEDNSKQNEIHLQFHAFHIVYTVAVHKWHLYVDRFQHSSYEQNILIYFEKF